MRRGKLHKINRFIDNRVGSSLYMYHIAGIFRKVKFSYTLKTTIFMSLIFALSIKIENMLTYNKIIVCEISFQSIAE